MKRFSILLCLVCLFAAACAHKTPVAGAPKDLLVGTWSMNGMEATAQFGADGSYSTTALGQTATGTYRWLDDTSVELTIAGHAHTIKVAVSQDQLTETDGANVYTFQRMVSNATPQSAASSAGSPTAGGSGIITRTVLAARVSPLTHAPIESADAFPADQGVINEVVTVSNAPTGTALRSVVTAVDTNNVRPPNTQVGTPTDTTTQGSTNVAFVWRYPNLPVGRYKAAIYLNGALNNTLNFSITKDATPAPQPTLGAIGNCPALPAPDEKPPGFTLGVTMAQGQDAQGNPVNPGRIFRPDAPGIYAILARENAPPNTHVEARWFATDLGGLETCNTQFFDFALDLPTGSGSSYFEVTPPSPEGRWPEGLYRVEIYVNGNQSSVTDFGVCDQQCKFKVPPLWTAP